MSSVVVDQVVVRRWRVGGKVVVSAATLLCLSSMGGLFLLTPILLPWHWWAARRSGLAGRIWFGLLGSGGMGLIAWAAVYTAVGEAKPTIWAVPLSVIVAVLAVFVRARPAPAATEAVVLDENAIAVLRGADGRFSTPVRLLVAWLVVVGALLAFAVGRWTA